MPQTQLDAGLIFSGKPSGTMISGYDEPSSYTPIVNPNYIFHDSSRDIIVWFLMEKPDPLYLCGPTSAGKSSLIRQIAARLNYPVFEATGHDRLEFPDLVGHLSVRDGNMEFQERRSTDLPVMLSTELLRIKYMPPKVDPRIILLSFISAIFPSGRL